MNKPILSARFDENDIQKLREYYSLQHINMTPSEIVEETKTATADVISMLIKRGNVKRVNTSI